MAQLHSRDSETAPVSEISDDVIHYYDIIHCYLRIMGPFKCYVMQWGVGVSAFPEKALRRSRFNVISLTRGWAGVKFRGKKRYVTLEWSPS